MTFLLAPVRSSFTTIPNRIRTTYRGEILSTSHQARIALLEEQLKQASDQKIRRICQLQIDSAEADYGMRVKRLDGAMERAEFVAEVVAYGIVGAKG